MGESLHADIESELFDFEDRTAIRRVVAQMKSMGVTSISDGSDALMFSDVNGWYLTQPGMTVREFYSGRVSDQIVAMLDECDERELSAIRSSIDSRVGWESASETLDGAADRLLSVVEKLVER